MAVEIRLYFNDQAVDEANLTRFSELRIDQAMGMAWEAELEMPIGLDAAGHWSGVEEDFAQPMARVRVEVKLGDHGFQALIDGPVVGQRIDLHNNPADSKLVLVVHDDSVALNRDERVALHEDMSASDIAAALFRQHALQPDVDAVAMPAGGLERVIVQRGTAMALLRELARRHGMWLYVRPGDAPGRSIGVFAQPRLSDEGLPEILILGPERHCSHFSASFDGLRPTRARADSVDALSVRAQSRDANTPAATLGERDSLELVSPGRTLLARGRETEQDLSATTAAAVDESAWAYTAEGELDASGYGAVLSPYRIVTVAGAGRYLGGRWLISRVTHVLNDDGYQQTFTLRRNARSDADAMAAIAGGIF